MYLETFRFVVFLATATSANDIYYANISIRKYITNVQLTVRISTNKSANSTANGYI